MAGPTSDIKMRVEKDANGDTHIRINLYKLVAVFGALGFIPLAGSVTGVTVTTSGQAKPVVDAVGELRQDVRDMKTQITILDGNVNDAVEEIKAHEREPYHPEAGRLIYETTVRQQAIAEDISDIKESVKRIRDEQ